MAHVVELESAGAQMTITSELAARNQEAKLTDACVFLL